MKKLTKENVKEIIGLNKYVAQSAVFSTNHFSTSINLINRINLIKLCEDKNNISVDLLGGTYFVPLDGTVEFEIEDVHNCIVLKVAEPGNRLTLVYSLTTFVL